MPPEIWQDLAIVGLVAIAAIAYWLWDPTGWKSLAQAYPHSERWPDIRIRARRAMLDGHVFSRGLLLGVSDRGLHVGSLDSRFEALVPWDQVAVTWAREPDIDDAPDDSALRFKLRLDFRDGGESLAVPGETAAELARAAGDRWPGPRSL